MQILNAALQQAHQRHAENKANPQLRQAANEFEASFLQELLKPMTEDSMFSSGSDGASGSMGTVGSIAAQALADGIAKDGGLGIAKRVLAELAPMELGKSKGAPMGATRYGGCAPQIESATTEAASVPTLNVTGPGSFISAGGSVGETGIMYKELH